MAYRLSPLAHPPLYARPSRVVRILLPRPAGPQVAVLSEKLAQLVEERDGLAALCDSQASDLALVSQEVIRLMPPGGTPATIPPPELSAAAAAHSSYALEASM